WAPAEAPMAGRVVRWVISAVVYGVGAGAASLLPFEVWAALTTACMESPPDLAWVGLVSAVGTALTAATLAGPPVGLAAAPSAGPRLAFGLASTWAAIVVGSAAEEFCLGWAWSYPPTAANFVSDTLVWGMIAAILAPAALVPWGLLEGLRRVWR